MICCIQMDIHLWLRVLWVMTAAARKKKKCFP